MVGGGSLRARRGFTGCGLLERSAMHNLENHCASLRGPSPNTGKFGAGCVKADILVAFGFALTTLGGPGMSALRQIGISGSFGQIFAPGFDRALSMDRLKGQGGQKAV